MRRLVLLLLLLALVLTSCGGPPPDTTVPDPPQATVIEKIDNDKVNKIVEEWKSSVPATMTGQGIKAETIEQKLYQSKASLQEIADFYKQQLTAKNWIEAPRMPGVQDGFLLTGYELGTTSLVVGAVDANQFEGSGVIVYTAKGTK
jgi:hypothetical protein